MLTLSRGRKLKIVKKRTKRFLRFQSDRFKRVSTSWRKPKGIDCRVRRKFKGTNLMPNIGYGSQKTTKHMLKNGLYKFRVRQAADLDMLLMQNHRFAAEIASNVSASVRKAALERAKQLNIFVINRKAKMNVQEQEA